MFGTSHIVAVAIAFGAGIGLIAANRLWDHGRLARNIRWGLASGLVVTWLLWFLLLYEKNWLSVASVLPMQLCDWTTIVVIVALISLNQHAYDLAYFWAFGGTLQALLTPDLTSDFPDPRFLIFFGLHGTVIASVLFLTLGLGMRPRQSSIPRVLLWSLIYLVAAFSVDEIFRVNFGYLIAKPTHSSLLDILEPWPYYIGEIVLLGGLLVVLLYLPFSIWDWLAERRAPKS